MNFNFKQLVPHLIAIALFAAITLFYFSPILKGKVIKQGDIVSHKGMSKEISDHRQKYHEEPLWTDAMFGGMPAYQISTIYKMNLLKYIDNLFKLYIPHPVGIVFLYFFGFYILMQCMRINPWLSVLGAIAFGFSSYFFVIIEAGHNSKAHAIA